MNIKLLGYYDNNLGDDLMREILVENMPEHKFYADSSQAEFLLHLDKYENVYLNNSDAEMDLYLNVIGTGFNFSSRVSILSKIASEIRIKRRDKTKRAVLNCSIDFPKHRIEKTLSKNELKKYDYISCRDNTSKGLIEKYTKRHDIHMHHDMVFAIDKSRIYPRTNEKNLGVVVAQRNYSPKNYPYYKAVAQACDQYIALSHKKVLLFAFDTGIENDTLAALSIQRLMQHGDKTEIIPYNSDIDCILKHFARCDRIISSRFHGVILSLVTQTPVLCVSDRQKVDIIAQQFGIDIIKKENLNSCELLEKIIATNTAVACNDSIANDAKQHIEDFKKYLQRW